LKGNNAERLAKSNHKERCAKYVPEFTIPLGELDMRGWIWFRARIAEIIAMTILVLDTFNLRLRDVLSKVFILIYSSNVFYLLRIFKLNLEETKKVSKCLI